ncbi:MAG: rhomboid family intramembrane serine protease [Alcanivoracaceae bacterium]|nr:rhomboid family intramembrane serine protease [Alcanivoracaceae bacterium]
MNSEIINLKISITITFVCTIVMVIFGYENTLLGYNADEFHVWQLITAHFVHYDVKHLITNMLALSLLLYLFPATFKFHLKAMVIAIILIDIYLYFSNVKYYVGYSGLLYVVPGMACYKLFQQKKYNHVVLMISILIFYLAIISPEYRQNQFLIWESLEQAHFLGFFSGILSEFTNRKLQLNSRSNLAFLQ